MDVAKKYLLILPAHTFERHGEYFKALEDCSSILKDLEEASLLKSEVVKKIKSVKDKAKQKKKMHKAIVKKAEEANFQLFCIALHSEEKLTESIINYYSILYSIISHDYENNQFETLLNRLTEVKFLSDAEFSQIRKHRTRKQKFIDIMYSKPVSSFSNFLQHLNKEETLAQLQMSIVKYKGEIDNNVSYTRSMSTGSLASVRTSSLSSGVQSVNKSMSSLTLVECTDSESGGSESHPRHIPKSPSTHCETEYREQNVLDIYRKNLADRYIKLPVLSRQGWIDKIAKYNFIDLTVEESWQNVPTNNAYSISTDEILNHETEYRTKKYTCYDDLFSFSEVNTHRLILIEGNAGCGKTTLAYRICKEWASGGMLKHYTHVVLIELRDLEPGAITTPEDFFTNMAKLASDIYKKLVNSAGLLIWLEGWDELNISLKQRSKFTELLHGQLFPNATIVVSSRPSANDSLAEFMFARKVKVVGFSPDQVENYVRYYCASNYEKCLPEKFLCSLKEIPCLTQLAENPLNLSILVKLFKGNQQLSQSITDIYHDLLIICLQNHKSKALRKRTLINSLDDLPEQMKKVFVAIEKYAFECIFCHRSYSEQEVSNSLFNSDDVPDDFDGLGLFGIEIKQKVAGYSKGYVFLYKPIEELLATVYISRLHPNEQVEILQEIFGTKTHEMVWVFHAGLTKMKTILIENLLASRYRFPSVSMIEPPVTKLNELLELWKQCHDHFRLLTKSEHINMEFLCTLILCCYEAKNTDACKVIADHFYPNNVGRIEIPESHAYPYFLIAISYFIAHSVKKWSLRCVVPVPSAVELLCTYINDPATSNSLWVWCCVVKLSDIEAYVKAVQSQLSLQWINFLDGSYLGNDGIHKLCECLKLNDHVMKLGLVNCGLEDNGLKSIADLLTTNHKILSIDLRKNDFSSEGLWSFLQAIKVGTHLESLIVDQRLFDYADSTEILKEINLGRKHSKLNCLDLVCK